MIVQDGNLIMQLKNGMDGNVLCGGSCNNKCSNNKAQQNNKKHNTITRKRKKNTITFLAYNPAPGLHYHACGAHVRYDSVTPRLTERTTASTADRNTGASQQHNLNISVLLWWLFMTREFLQAVVIFVISGSHKITSTEGRTNTELSFQILLMICCRHLTGLRQH